MAATEILMKSWAYGWRRIKASVLSEVLARDEAVSGGISGGCCTRVVLIFLTRPPALVVDVVDGILDHWSQLMPQECSNSTPGPAAAVIHDNVLPS